MKPNTPHPKKFLHRIALGSLVLIGFHTSVLWSEDDDFFSLPSPSEILADAENNGLSVKLTPKDVAILKIDLKQMAETNPEKATFIMGRIFSIAGYGLKDLNNKVILQLAEKVLTTAKALNMPPIIQEEIDRFYRLMMGKTVWERQELLLSFTSARASLMFLLKDPNKVGDVDRDRLGRYGAALECGLWYQSLELAIASLKDDQMKAFKKVYMDPDYLDYFKKMLDHVQAGDQKELFSKLIAINEDCLNALRDGEIVHEEIESLRKVLAEVMKND